MRTFYLDAGITGLGEAIEHGKAGHADVAITHAKSAVRHLKEIDVVRSSEGGDS